MSFRFFLTSLIMYFRMKIRHDFGLFFKKKQSNVNMWRILIIDYFIAVGCRRTLSAHTCNTFWPIYNVHISHVHDYNFSFHQNVFCHSLSTNNRDYTCLDILDCWIFSFAFCQRNFAQCYPHTAMVNRKYYMIFTIQMSLSVVTLWINFKP